MKITLFGPMSSLKILIILKTKTALFLYNSIFIEQLSQTIIPTSMFIDKKDNFQKSLSYNKI